MDFIGFKNWLFETKKLSARSRYDSASRCRRVLRLLNISEFDENTVEKLNECDEYNKLSASVKSQLKRSVINYLEFLKCNK